PCLPPVAADDRPGAGQVDALLARLVRAAVAGSRVGAFGGAVVPAGLAAAVVRVVPAPGDVVGTSPLGRVAARAVRAAVASDAYGDWLGHAGTSAVSGQPSAGSVCDAAAASNSSCRALQIRSSSSASASVITSSDSRRPIKSRILSSS